MKYQHLVFYDGECGLCDRAVQWILTKDVEEQFCFAPLQGETAARLLNDDVKKVDSLVLVEFYKTDPKIFLEGDAMLTICAKLPFPYSMLGVFKVLPACCYNSVYRWVANHRKQLMDNACFVPDSSKPNRFLK